MGRRRSSLRIIKDAYKRLPAPPPSAELAEACRRSPLAFVNWAFASETPRFELTDWQLKQLEYLSSKTHPRKK